MISKSSSRNPLQEIDRVICYKTVLILFCILRTSHTRRRFLTSTRPDLACALHNSQFCSSRCPPQTQTLASGSIAMKNKVPKDQHMPQAEEEPVKKKSRKMTKPMPPKPQPPTEEDPEPMASSSAIELKKTDGSQQSKATSFDDLRAEAAEHACNELIKAQAICCDDFKKHFLRTNIDGMVQILDLTAAIVPFESHELLKARDRLLEVVGHPPRCHIQREPPTESLRVYQQPTEQGNAKPSSSDISHALCSWARYEVARHRIHGLTLDSEGRLSLNNVMECWGQWKGLNGADILRAIERHTQTEGEDRYALQSTADDIMIQVRASKRSQQSTQRGTGASSRRHQQKHRY